jgi:hypothetical protein
MKEESEKRRKQEKQEKVKEWQQVWMEVQMEKGGKSI